MRLGGSRVATVRRLSGPTTGQAVIALDIEEVSIDLETIPLDDVLAFRAENLDAHRGYMSQLRQFATDVSLAEDADRTRLLRDRTAELREAALELRKRALGGFGKKKDVAGFGLGLTGAAWSLGTGNPIPAALAALGIGIKMLPDVRTGTAYSYLFKAQRELR